MSSSKSPDDYVFSALGVLLLWVASYWVLSYGLSAGLRVAGYKDAAELSAAVAKQETIINGADVVLNSTPPVTASTKLLRDFHEISARAARDKETAERKLAKLDRLEPLSDGASQAVAVVSVALFPLAGAAFAAWSWSDDRKRAAAQKASQERMAAKIAAAKSAGLRP